MKKNLYYIVYIGVLMMLLAGCQDEGMFTPEEETSETPVNVSFRVKLGGEEMSRAIGDASLVNELIVGVFQDSKLLKTFTYTRKEGEDKFTDVTIPLFKNQTYDLAFWAQVKDNGIYSINGENFNITIDYSQYKNISLAGTEAFEAFSYVRTGVTVAEPGEPNITLTRPFAQLNVAASEGEIFDNVDATRFTISKVYTSYNPFSGPVGDLVEKEFSFKYINDTPQSTTIGGKNYYYLASAYLLAPEKVGMTGGLYMGNEEYKALNFTELPLAANTRTNIYGDMIQQETMQGWDGITFTEPTDEGLLCEVKPEDMGLEGEVQPNEILHIDTPEELAYCMKNGYPEGIKVIHICSNLNMGGHDWSDLPAPEGMTRSSRSVTPYSIPAGITIVGDSPEGTLPFIVSNITVSSTGLFGDAESLTVKNIIFKNIHVSVQSSHAGVLVGTLKGNSLFQNVTLEECSVGASLNAGGMVGYISRKSEKDRAETLSVSFNGCQVNKTTLTADNTGKFVGLFNGYDNQETLTFDSECTSLGTTENVGSPYREGNESVWQQDNDYASYNDFLGDETYYRGIVTLGENQFAPKWDGTTTIEPLLANPTYDGANAVAGSNKFVVYSPFDLTGVKKKTASPAAIYLKADIDMNGQGADGEYNVPSNFTQSAHTSTDDNVFDPFNYVTTLDGKKSDTENYSIYNLCIEQIEQERAAFILYASGTTTHKNINFRNCQTVAVHKVVTTDAKAYGAILVSNVDATYTMENVHAYDCKVFALQKVGTLGARISGTSTLKNNSVNNCYVENYECMISERFDSGTKEMAGFTARVYADFYPHGEVGGMYGFIQGTSKMTDCNVNSTTVYAYGQNDKKATVEGSGLVQAGIALLGYYLVPGRHVGTMIGNIRATGAVTLTNCKVDGNSECTNRWDKHQWRKQTGGSWLRPTYTYYTYDYIGQAYYVEFVDSKGSVTVDGTALTLGDCKDGTLYGTH